MSEDEDLRYLETRFRQSVELAETSDDISVRIVHREMAEAYALRIAALKRV